MAVKSIAQIKVDILATIYENTSMQVTAQHEQDRMNDIADSYYNRLENIVMGDMLNISDSTGQSVLSFGNTSSPNSVYFWWTNDGFLENDAEIYVDTDGFLISTPNASASISASSLDFTMSGGGAIFRGTTAAVASSVRGIQFSGSLGYLYHATKLTFDSALYNFSSLTASRVPYIDASSNLVVSAITPTELGYLSGLTSNVQNQINNLLSGLAWKQPVRVASTANITISSPGSTIDSTTMVSGDRVLLRIQNVTTENGLYVWNGSGVPMTRCTDANTGALILGATVVVEEGTYADQIWTCSTNAPITIGTTPLAFIKTSATTYTASNGVALSGNNFLLDYAYFAKDATIDGVGNITVSSINTVPIALAGGFQTFGAYTIQLTTTAATTLTLPITGTLATLVGSETFSNKIIDNTCNIAIKDSEFLLQDNGNTTRRVQFDLGGLTAGFTRTWTFPDANGTFLGSGTAASLISLALTGTGGNGFATFLTQSSQPTYGASGFVLYANATGKLAWRNQADTYERSLSATLTADRIYTLPDASGTFPLGTGGTSQLSYWSGTNAITSDSNTLINGTSYLFGYSALAASELAGFQKNQNGGTTIAVTNTTSGTAGLAGVVASNSSTIATSVFMRSYSATYTTSGINVADAGSFGTSKAGGLNVGTTSATQLSFWTNNTEQARFLSTGEFIIGATAVVSGEYVSIQKSQNAGTSMRMKNATSGTAATTSYLATNSGNISLSMGINSAGFTTSGINVAATAAVFTNSTSGINIGTNVAGQLGFWTNNVEVGRFNSTGEFGVGMTPVNLFDIQKDQNVATILSCLNANGTGAAQAQIRSTNGTYNMVVSMLGTAFTTSGLNVANLAKLVTTATAGMLIQSNVAATNIYIAIGGAGTANEVARFDVNGLSFQNALMGLTFKVQANSLVGRATLVAGTVAVTITGLTTSHKAFVQLQAPGGTLGVGYKAVCTANTLTITSVIAAGTINNTDTSILDYFIVLTN